ncbi:endonuclease [Dethiosulfovibrio sp. F2B]|uniref:endonuclease n=1 Tax=Dethiosulfovibrio faecalis TaxID=2720018 RepID=UPI001F42613F|nr:endonuclease [Dethiosulfovibrio faecalis]MCF4151378.1 endonuclease [Dethiosulfovibrio faecalis]
MGKYFGGEVNLFLAIDPGRSKFGWALVEENGRFLCSGITGLPLLESFLSKLKKKLPLSLDEIPLEGKLETNLRCEIDGVFIGNGTGRELFIEEVERFFPWCHLIDESNSTLEAREIYWTFHPPTGWRRFLPLSLQTPPRSVDDLAAYCIAMRGIREFYDKEIR